MKKILFIVFAFLITMALTNTGCYYDKAENLYPDTVCDTASVTYSTTVAPVLSSFCNSCHSGAAPSAGIKLDAYNDVKIQAANGRLWGAISHGTSYSPMPKNAAKLNTCNLAKIKKWLDAGYPNN